MTIKQLSQATGVRQSTLKYYSELGILPFEQEAEGLRRQFDKKIAEMRLKHIAAMKRANLDMEAIQEKLRNG